MNRWGAPAEPTQAERLARLVRDLCNTRPELLLKLTPEDMIRRHQKLHRNPAESARIVEAKLLAAQDRARREMAG